MEPFVFRATRPHPHLGLWTGDQLVVEPGHATPVVLTRQLPPNYGAILLAESLGGLELVTRSLPLEALAAAVGEPCPSPSFSPAPSRSHRGLGWRVRRARLQLLP